ncbi:SRPBCC family protein [Arthrobacter sp. JSM 101049]|uniref:SRPBCC family protein n=1 Tax=Arthrobacter sp. JSM 101049 TaxID=929097 RepID=UPI0035682E99
MGTDETFGEGTACTASELIRLPRPRVWFLLTDFTAAPLWLPGVTEMHADGPLATGVEVDVHVGNHVRTHTVSSFIPEHELCISTGDGDVHTTYAYRLADSGDDTRLELAIDVVVSAALAAEAEGIRASVAADEAGHLARFRAYAELAP